MNSVAILSDSRGRCLHPRFADSVYYRGANLDRLVTYYVRDFGDEYHDVIYVNGGVNNITVRLRSSGKLTLISHNPLNIVDYLVDELEETKNRIVRELPGVDVVMCPIYGLDIARYNQEMGRHHLQDVVDASVVDINRHVREMNNQNGMYTPHFANVIHRYMGPHHPMQHLYRRLVDGLHPRRATAQHITTYLDRTIQRNQRMGNHY